MKPHNRITGAWVIAFTVVWLAALLVLAFSRDVAAQATPDLLQPLPGTPPPTHDGRRARRVRINLDALQAPRIRVELFGGAAPEFVRTDRPGTTPAPLPSNTWAGTSDGGDLAILTTVAGVLHGALYVGAASFTLAPADGDYLLVEVNPARFPRERAPVVFPPDPEPGPHVEPADHPVMDLMVVWTPQAEAGAGGATALRSMIANAVALTNATYANSLVDATVRLVYTGRVEYKETTISNDLAKLRGTTDGAMDDVHALRTKVGADLVAMIGNSYKGQGWCGMAGLMSTPSTAFASSAFAVVDRRCAVANLSFPHELGHNQGLHHDPPNAGSKPSYPYAYGHQDPAKLFRTVMAYGSATRRPYLSNPAVLYREKPTGVANVKENAKALGLNAPIVAAFKPMAGAAPTR